MKSLRKPAAAWNPALRDGVSHGLYRRPGCNDTLPPTRGYMEKCEKALALRDSAGPQMVPQRTLRRTRSR